MNLAQFKAQTKLFRGFWATRTDDLIVSIHRKSCRLEWLQYGAQKGWLRTTDNENYYDVYWTEKGIAECQRPHAEKSKRLTD